tara:strand:- start:2463 stop:3206 length:744 start_codon:yes stop_codon:yes gene_type:complete
MKTLLAITTYNQLKFTKLCINTLEKVRIPGLEIIFIDDVSTDGTVNFLKESRWNLDSRKEPKGLTWSWNKAYRQFKNKNYDNLILSNNDVLLTQQGINEFMRILKNNTLVVPLSTRRGAGHNWKEQSASTYYPSLRNKMNGPESHVNIQSEILQKVNLTKRRHRAINNFNGFFFGMNRSIISSAYNENNLFNPKLTNVGQETDLLRRLKSKPILSLGCFVYHYKGVSFNKKGLKNGKDIRQNLNLYH